MGKIGARFGVEGKRMDGEQTKGNRKNDRSEVDYITTDEPLLVREIISEKK